MRKLLLGLILFTFFIAGFVVFIMHRIYVHAENSNNISVRVKETDDTYQIYASYSRFKSRQIQNYVDRQLKANHTFRNARIDADMTFENNMLVHVKSKPGLLVIRMDKTKNDSDAYYRIKELGEGIKDKLTEGGNY